MADTLPYLTRLWCDRPMYLCPVCGTSRATIARIEHHIAALGHTAPPMDSPAPQADAVPAASSATAVAEGSPLGAEEPTP